MSLFSGLFVISTLAFATFCFYCGVSAIGEKLKKDGLLSVVEGAVLVFLVTAVLLLAINKVNSALTRPSFPTRSFKV